MSNINYNEIRNQTVDSFLTKIRNINLLILHPFLFILIIGGYTIAYIFFDTPNVVKYVCFVWILFPIYFVILFLNWNKIYIYSRSYLLYPVFNSIWGGVIIFLLFFGVILMFLDFTNSMEFIIYVYFLSSLYISIYLIYFIYFYKKWKKNWDEESFKYLSLLELKDNIFDVINPYQKLENYSTTTTTRIGKLIQKTKEYTIPFALTLSIVLPVVTGISSSTFGANNMEYLLIISITLYLFIIPSMSKIIAKNYVLYKGIKDYENEKGIKVYNGMW